MDIPTLLKDYVATFPAAFVHDDAGWIRVEPEDIARMDAFMTAWERVITFVTKSFYFAHEPLKNDPQRVLLNEYGFYAAAYRHFSSVLDSSTV